MLLVDSELPIWLPIEAFDGALMSKPLQSLQQQWEELLYQYE
jgi:hypothetical protein